MRLIRGLDAPTSDRPADHRSSPWAEFGNFYAYKAIMLVTAVNVPKRR